MTGRAFDLGMVGLVQFLPTALLVFVAGHAADRFERKRVIQLCQVAEALTALFLAWGSYRRLAHRGAHLHRDLRARHGRRLREPGDRGAAAVDRAARHLAARDRAIRGRDPDRDHHRARARRPRLCARARSALWRHAGVLVARHALHRRDPRHHASASKRIAIWRRRVRRRPLHPQRSRHIGHDLARPVRGAVRRCHRAAADLCARHPAGRPVRLGRAARRAGGRRAAHDGCAGAPYHQQPRGPTHVPGGDRLRRCDCRLRVCRTGCGCR